VAHHETLTRAVKVIQLGINAFVILLSRVSQRAEYLADALGAQVAETRAAASMLQKLGLVGNFARRASGIRIDMPFLDEWRDSISRLPDRKRERIRRVSQLEASRLSATHPRTASRLRVIRGRPASIGSVVLSVAVSQRLDKELRSACRARIKSVA
jgi:Zn-dependent protease with chaperone function